MVFTPQHIWEFIWIRTAILASHLIEAQVSLPANMIVEYSQVACTPYGTAFLSQGSSTGQDMYQNSGSFQNDLQNVSVFGII